MKHKTAPDRRSLRVLEALDRDMDLLEEELGDFCSIVFHAKLHRKLLILICGCSDEVM